MPTPYYVSPEQIMQEKEDFARKGIERAKEVIVLEYQDGIRDGRGKSAGDGFQDFGNL